MSRRILPTRRPGETRRDWPVPIASGRSTKPRVTAGEIELPVILVSALAMLDITVPTFFDRLRSAWSAHDVVFMASDTEISVEAHLGADSLRCAIRLAQMCWYHHPGDEIHIFCIELPETILAATDLPIGAVVDHDLLADPRIVVRSIDHLNPALPGIGIRLRLTMPMRTCSR